MITGTSYPEAVRECRTSSETTVSHIKRSLTLNLTLNLTLEPDLDL